MSHELCDCGVLLWFLFPSLTRSLLFQDVSQKRLPQQNKRKRVKTGFHGYLGEFTKQFTKQRQNRNQVFSFYPFKRLRPRMPPLEEEKKFRRNYKACLSCRTRKIKCDLGSVEDPQPPCARCKREQKECVFAESRRGGSSSNPKKKRKVDDGANGHSHWGSVGYPAHPQPINPDRDTDVVESSVPNTSVSAPSASYHLQGSQPSNFQPQSSIRTASHVQRPPSSASSSTNNLRKTASESNISDETYPVPPPTQKSSEFSTMQGALVFLARAAGTIAKADDRDKLSARKIHEQIENHESETSSLNSPHRNDSNGPQQAQKSSADYDLPLIRPQGRERLALPPVEKTSAVHPNPSKTLSDIPYIGADKMLTEEEATHLINLFFLTLHPFFPHIPEQLHSPQILAGYPILLCAILTIASRYHPFEKDRDAIINKNSRNIQLHERLWIYCQRLISQTVWAEASTRSIGTALAFLLFTEWNPRAIHWRWSDYANNPDLQDEMVSSDRGPDESEDGEGLAGLSAMRRSDRMAWMLVGTSVRLSQDMGFISGVPEIFVATHIAETNTAMSLGQRSMLSQSLGEIDLDKEDDHDAPDSNDSGNRYNDQFLFSLDEETTKSRLLQKKSLKFTGSQKAKIELLKIMSLAYETVYSGSYNQIDQLNGQNLAILSVLSPLIENWYKTYKKLLKPSNPKNFNHHCNLKNAGNPKHVHEITKQIDKESVISDYYYCQLYIYSLALTTDNPLNSNVSDAKKPLNNIRLYEISKAAKFVELAYNAAKEILNAAIRVHKLKMLKYMPVRWVTRIVRAVAFIVKCFLTLTNAGKQAPGSSPSQTSAILKLSIIPTDDILSMIQKAAIALREASPDELHLCTRYSTILMFLCSEMKYRSKLSANPPKPTKLDFSEDDEDDRDEQTAGEEDPSESAIENQNYSNIDVSSSQFNSTNTQSRNQHSVLQQYGDSFEQYSRSTGSNTSTPPIPNFGYQQMGRGSLLPDSIMDWFMKNDEAVGLDFVEPWTEMLEQQLGRTNTSAKPNE